MKVCGPNFSYLIYEKSLWLVPFDFFIFEHFFQKVLTHDVLDQMIYDVWTEDLLV